MYKKHMVVPAEPNWYALDWCFQKDDSGVFVAKETILAWVVSIYEEHQKVTTSIEPVTQEKMSSFYEGAILRPDGSVCISGLEYWHTLADYQADVRKRHHNNATTFMNKAEALNEAKV